VHAFLPTIVAAEHTLKPAVFPFERHQLGAAFNHDAGFTQPFVQNVLGLCLRDDEDERKARVHCANVTEHRCRNRPALEVQLETCACLASGHELFAEAERLEQLQRARLDGERPGFTCAIDKAIDDPKPHAKHLKLRRQRESSWTCADD
jgi:hypothetical protein